MRYIHKEGKHGGLDIRRRAYQLFEAATKHDQFGEATDMNTPYGGGGLLELHTYLVEAERCFTATLLFLPLRKERQLR